MSKVLKNRNLSERPATRALLAISLATSMAAFGCTTDRNLGNGDPVVTPGLRTSPTGGSSAGSESGSVPPPMTSSYSGAQAVRPRIARMSAAEAAALLAEQQPRVRVLGPVSPNSAGRPYVSDSVSLTVQPAAPYSTVNSSIYSAPTSVISSGAGEAIPTADEFLASLGDAGAAAVIGTGTTATGSTVAGSSVTGASTVTGTPATTGATTLGTPPVTNAGGAVIAPTSAATASPTAQSMAAPSAFASVRTLSPTAASVVNPPASISSSPTLAAVSSARTAGTAARTSAVTTSNAATGTAATTGTAAAAGTTKQAVTATGSVSNPVRVMTTNGRVTVTNATNRQQ